MYYYTIFLLLAVSCLPCLTRSCKNQQTINVILHNFPPYLTIPKQQPAKDKTSHNHLEYEGLLGEDIKKLRYQCKESCFKWNETQINDDNEAISQFQNSKETTFLFPVPVHIERKMRSNDSAVRVIPTEVKENNFILIVDIKRCREEFTEEIFETVQKQSPLLGIIFLLAANAGVILWILEARQNKEEFSNSFFRGTFDGFWWAFVSMTTVGYGDKTPRTTIGRVFGMIWITLGIVLVAFFTATIASIITITTVENSCHGLRNRNVAIMSNDKKIREFVDEKSPKDVKNFSSFPEMFNAWRGKRMGINSLFVEERLALYYLQNKDRSEIKDIRVTKTVSHGSKTLFYSMVKKVNECSPIPCGLEKFKLHTNFLPAPSSPKLPGLFVWSFQDEVDQPFSIGSPETIPILKILGISFGCLAVLGYIGITVARYLKRRKKRKTPEIEQVKVASQTMETVNSSHQILELKQSLNLIAQEITEMRKVLDSTES